VNPSVKLQYIRDNWTEEEAEQAEKWMEDVMLEYYKASLSSSSSGPAVSGNDSPSLSTAATASSHNPQRRGSGYLRLRTDPSLRRSVSPAAMSESTPYESPATGHASYRRKTPYPDHGRHKSKMRCIELLYNLSCVPASKQKF
ncbi:hypothetical protein FRB90_006005, partial [Tulasnella sp. 427]